MSELPKRNVTRPAGSRPAGPARSNDASNLDSARAALARAIAAHRAESSESSESSESTERTERTETDADRSAPAHGVAGPGLPRSSEESAYEISPTASPRRWAFPRRRRWILAAAVGVVVVAVVAGVAVTAGGGSDSSSHQADAPAEGLVPSGGEDTAGGQSLLPAVPAPKLTASPSADPSTAPSSSSSKSAQGTPKPGKGDASTGSGSSPAADDSETDSAAGPGTGDPSGSTTGSGNPLVVEASGKCLTGAGSGSQLVASACDGSAGQSWSPESDGTLRQGGLCAALTGTEDRTPVVLATCDRSSTQRISFSGTALVSGPTGKCLDLFGGASGTQIVLWECNGRDNQHWSAA